MKTTTRLLLVVEDSDEDFETVAEAAAVHGPQAIRRARTGDECLGLLRGAHPAPALRPALVLLDLQLPGLDGRETLAAIRGEEALRDIPVVIFSTSSNPRDIAGSYALGANAYHVKPLRYDQHRATLDSLLEYWFESAVLPDGVK